MSYATALPPPPSDLPRQQHHTTITPLELACPATPANFRPEDDQALDLVASIPERTMRMGGSIESIET
ncbi:hypothetical protein JB92DRAFT_3113724 [Gautieria morchelliformis]|nr:hypothetical protein JB92DRAFT_3113724 [Gautieria morchelliformis]